VMVTVVMMIILLVMENQCEWFVKKLVNENKVSWIYLITYFFLPKVLNSLIVEYQKPLTWKKEAFKFYETKGRPRGLIPFQSHLYLCSFDTVCTYNKLGEIIKENNSFKHPSAMDIDITNSLIFIADLIHVTLVDLNLAQISLWKLPAGSQNSYFISRSIKIDKERIYLTMASLHQVFICNKMNGEIFEKWGRMIQSSDEGEYNDPRGLTVNEKYVYICDSDNHRVQVVTKEKGIYINSWRGTKKGGQFYWPYSIFLVEDIFFCG